LESHLKKPQGVYDQQHEKGKEQSVYRTRLPIQNFGKSKKAEHRDRPGNGRRQPGKQGKFPQYEYDQNGFGDGSTFSTTYWAEQK